MVKFDVRADRVDNRERIGALLSRRAVFAGLLVVIAVYYLLLLSNGTFELFAPEMFSRVFDNMLVHLLHGEFTVDRSVIDYEAFTRNGKTYSYFGIFPALLRLAAMPFTDVATVELARASCLTAVVIFVALQLRMLLIAHNSLPPGSRVPWALTVMAAATVLSGPQLYILGTAYIYQEPILWSAAMAAAFNLIVLRAALEGGGLRSRDLVSMAALAGLAINTRPPIGVALYLGTVLLVLWTAWRRHEGERRLSANPRGIGTAIAALLRDRSVVWPIVVLGLLGVAVSVVNFERWGNPLSFGNFHYNYWIRHNPTRLAALENYGDLNLGRAWIGALYYATGIPYVLKSVPPFGAYLQARFVAIEAPPIIPLLTNPLTILLAGIGLYRLWSRSRPRLPGDSVAILRLALIGNASAVALIFMASGLAMRYRFDLAPFMTLAAIVGYRSVSLTAAESSEAWRRRLRIAAVGLCVLGILASHYVLLIHKVWSIGSPMEVRRALSVFAPFAFKP
jgi:hypothetical protein